MEQDGKVATTARRKQMKKSYSFDVLSDKVCANPNCDRRLKRRIAEERPRFNLCYAHFMKKKRVEQNQNTR